MCAQVGACAAHRGMTNGAASDRAGTTAPVAPAFEMLPAGSAEETRLIREFADHATVGFSLYELPTAPGEPGRFRFVNRAYLQLLGMPTELALSEVGDAVLDVLHPDDRVLTDTMVADLQAGRPTAVVLRMIRPDGTVRWVRSRRSPVLDSDGRLARIVGTAEDVTDLETAAAALADSQEQFHQLADNVAVGFTLTELTDPPRMVYWNRAFLQILGIDPAQGMLPVGQLLATHLHPDDMRKWAAGLAAIRAGETLDEEVRILQSDGQLRWLRVRRSPVRNADGVVFRAAGTTEDITERKTAESALRFAQSEADRANAAKNEFLSRMSHELRTPLNAVLGFAQLLEMDQLSESQADAVGYILRGGRHLLALINDVLDIAGIEADRLELSIEPVHVGSALSDALSMVHAQARDAGVELRLDDAGPGTSYFVQADQRRLRQVLINLLSNAIKYNRRGGWVRLSAEETGTSQVRLVVTDSGIGIRSEDMDRLFVPFDRIGQQVSGIEGTGIGLALSQRLVAFMGGHFDASSEFGSGSVFGVTLPRSDYVEQPVAHAAVEPVVPEVPESVSTLLYIEDNHSNVRLLQRILQRRPQWNLVHTDRGRRGLELVAECDPTLIILDLHLPDISGIEVLRQLREQPDRALRPLVVASADASPGQVSRLKAAGVDAFVAKPLDVHDILALLDQHQRAPGAERPFPVRT